MADTDKMVGLRITGGSKIRTWGGYRIDYDDPRSITELARDNGDITENETLDDIAELSAVAVKNPPAGYTGHEAKSGYQRKAVVEYEGEDGSNNRITTARDKVQSILDAFAFDVSAPEDVYPDQDERDAINRWGADNGLDVPYAIRWMRAVVALDEGHITDAQFERWNDPDADLSQTPDLTLEDASLLNDGADTETVTVSHPFSEEREAVLIIGNSSFGITLVPGENISESVTTTKSAGSTIDVELVGNFLGPAPKTIEVTE